MFVEARSCFSVSNTALLPRRLSAMTAVGRSRGQRRRGRTSYRLSSDEGPVTRGGRPRGSPRIKFAPPVQPAAKLDPDEVIVHSGRVASRGKIDTAYRYLSSRANTATTFGELAELKERNEAAFARIRDTRWAGVGEKKYRRCNEIIAKRYDKLRETESATRIGAGARAGPGPTVTGSGVFEKRTSKQPPSE